MLAARCGAWIHQGIGSILMTGVGDRPHGGAPQRILTIRDSNGDGN